MAKLKCSKKDTDFFKEEIKALERNIKNTKYKPYKKEYKKLKKKWENRLKNC